MTITLSPDQLAWIEARVAKGDYRSVDEAVRDLLATASPDTRSWSLSTCRGPSR